MRAVKACIFSLLLGLPLLSAQEYFPPSGALPPPGTGTPGPPTLILPGNNHPLGGNFYIDLLLGAYRLDAPAFSFGEILDPFPFAAAGIAPIPELAIAHGEHVYACYPKLALGVEMNMGDCFCWVGSNITFEVGVFYAERDKNDHLGDGTFPDFALPTVNGGSDFLASTLGIPTAFSGVGFQRTYRYAGMQAKLGSDFLFKHSPQFYLNGFFEFDYVGLQQDYRIHIGRLAGGANATEFHLNEHVTTTYMDYGLGLGSSYFFSPSCRSLFLYGEVAGFLSCAHTHLKAREHAVFPLFGFSQNELRNDYSTLSGKARGQLGIGYQFGYNFTLSCIGQAEYWGYIPRVVNPHRVGHNILGGGVYDYPVHIEQEHAFNYALVVGLTFVFF